MFFRTSPKLLRPIHSLLTEPFQFSANSSVTGPLRETLVERTDYDALSALAAVYDASRTQLQKNFFKLRTELESSLSVIIPQGTRLDAICRATMTGQIPVLSGMDGPSYLAYVSVQCQLERLFDHLGLRQTGQGDALQHPSVPALLRFFMLNEILALSLSGLVKVTRRDMEFFFEPFDETARKTLRATWFARFADQQSHAATAVMAKKMVDAGMFSVADASLLVARIMDRDLSIPWLGLGADGYALKSIVQAHEAVSLVAVLMMALVRQQPVKMSQPELRARGLDYSAVSRVLSRQSGALATDRFVSRNGDSLSLRVEAASKGLRTYLSVLAKEFDEVDKLRIHVGGKYFEDNIRARLEGDEYSPRYRVVDGFDRYGVLGSQKNECDVEFIICDHALKHYYFVQVKHALLGEKAFFDAAVQAAQNDFAKGIRQLREAKRLLVSGFLSKTLSSRGIPEATAENTSFVLLHNIAQFDFHSADGGICLYEWASFRNLLRGAETTVGGLDGSMRQVRIDKPLCLGDPQAVISQLFSEHPAYKGLQDAVWAAERVVTEYEIGGTQFRLKGLGV